MFLTCRYGEGALIPEVDQTSSERTFLAPTGRRQEYLPSSQPGARLPHFPIVIHRHSAPLSSLKVRILCSIMTFLNCSVMDFLYRAMICASFSCEIDTADIISLGCPTPAAGSSRIEVIALLY